MKCSKMRGTTLIEVIAYIALSLIIVTVTTKILMDTRKIYNRCMEKNYDLNIINDFFINLSNIVSANNVKEITLDNDILKIDYYGEDNKTIEVKKIYFNTNRVEVKYSNLEENINVLLKDVDNFKFEKRGKLIFVLVEKNNEEYDACL